MSAYIVPTEEPYVLNHCTKYLARTQGEVSESWRFPIIDSYGTGDNHLNSYAFNLVTFVYDGNLANASPPAKVGVVGSFATLYEVLPLAPVTFGDEPTGYFALSVVVPKSQVHTYKFIVDGQSVPDPINPQRMQSEEGQEWSRFFTYICTQPLCFERWEYTLLSRLTDHILPFRTKEGQNFLDRHYFDLDRQTRDTQLTHAYRLDNSVGVVNYIDNVLAREEHHRLLDYKLCLNQIDKVLRLRHPHVEPEFLPRDLFVDLYNEMGQNSVEGWNYEKYANPSFFLQLLRRHTLTGAFAHPKYGGNNAAAAWAFLAERYVSDQAPFDTLFDWRKAIEAPLGESQEYFG